MSELGILLFVLLFCCDRKEISAQGRGYKGYQWIEKQEAFEMMKKYTNYKILDVRSKDEYLTGHLPKAVNLPLDDLEEECLDLLPNLNQVVFVYCSSGGRSRIACEQMAAMGYANIYGFGGFQK